MPTPKILHRRSPLWHQLISWSSFALRHSFFQFGLAHLIQLLSSFVRCEKKKAERLCWPVQDNQRPHWLQASMLRGQTKSGDTATFFQQFLSQGKTKEPSEEDSIRTWTTCGVYVSLISNFRQRTSLFEEHRRAEAQSHQDRQPEFSDRFLVEESPIRTFSNSAISHWKSQAIIGEGHEENQNAMMWLLKTIFGKVICFFGALPVQRRRDHRSAECRQPHHKQNSPSCDWSLDLVNIKKGNRLLLGHS